MKTTLAVMPALGTLGKSLPRVTSINPTGGFAPQAGHPECHDEPRYRSLSVLIWIFVVAILGMNLAAGYLLWAKVTCTWPFL